MKLKYGVYVCLTMLACSDPRVFRHHETVKVRAQLQPRQQSGLSADTGQTAIDGDAWNDDLIPPWNETSRRWLSETRRRAQDEIQKRMSRQKVSRLQQTLRLWQKHFLTAKMSCGLLRDDLLQREKDEYVAEDLKYLLAIVDKNNTTFESAMAEATDIERETMTSILTYKYQHFSLELLAAWTIMAQQHIAVSPELKKRIVSQLDKVGRQARQNLKVLRGIIADAALPENRRKRVVAELDRCDSDMKDLVAYSQLMTMDDSCSPAYHSQRLFSRMSKEFFQVFPDKCLPNKFTTEPFGASSCKVSEEDAFSIKVKSLRLGKNPFVVHRLQQWGNEVVVHGNESVYIVDLERRRLSPLHAGDCDAPLTVATDGRKRYALCHQKAQLTVWIQEEIGTDWARISVFDMQKPERSWLHVSGEEITIVSDKTMFRSTADKMPRVWESRSIVDLLMPPSQSPSAVLIGAGELWVGCDNGEWGGTLKHYEMTSTIALDSSDSADSVRNQYFLGGDNIVRLKLDDSSNVWALSHLEHLSSKRNALMKYDVKSHQDSITALLNMYQNGKMKDEHLITFDYPRPSHCVPGEEVVTAFDVHGGDVYLFAGDVGILKIHNDELSVVIDMDFSVLPMIVPVMKKNAPNAIDYYESTNFERATDMMVLDNGDILLSTPRFGVILFIKQPDGYQTRQFLVTSGLQRRTKGRRP